MTARLRELAEDWRTRSSNLTVDPKDKRRCAIGQAYLDCADEILSILDAEGDGGAVGDGELPGMWSSADFTGGDPDERSHTARSGGVSDADVLDASTVYLRSRQDGMSYDESMRAALTHFAKGERHE